MRLNKHQSRIATLPKREDRGSVRTWSTFFR
jgi:hypothetical protein